MRNVDAVAYRDGHRPLLRTALGKRMAYAVGGALLAGAAPLWAGPGGEQVAAGQASVSRSGSNTLINQSSERAAINWQNFDWRGVFTERLPPAVGSESVLGHDGDDQRGAEHAAHR